MTAFTCPRCGRTSHHPADAEHGYCGACHDWTRDAWTRDASPIVQVANLLLAHQPVLCESVVLDAAVLCCCCNLGRNFGGAVPDYQAHRMHVAETIVRAIRG